MKQNVVTGFVFVLLIGLFAFAANDWKTPWAGKPAHGQDWCEEHKTPLSTCEICNPKLARGGTFTTREREPEKGECPNTLVRITLGQGVAQAVALSYGTAELKTLAESLRANAETMYTPSQHARVAPRIPGIIREVKALLGQEVEAGTLLAVLESSEFGQAKADYLQAQSLLRLRQETFDQDKILVEKKISTGRELLQATTNLEEAKLSSRRSAQKLQILGLSEAQVKAVSEKQDTSALMDLVAPFKGVVVEAAAVPGEMASPEKPIYSVAAVERLWVAIDVAEIDLPKIEKDQKVSFTIEALPGQRFPGKVVAIAGEVDDRTRTARVYADVKNVQGRLRAKMFGRAEISVKPPEPKLLIPKEAVQNDGDCDLVFVSPTPNIFQARKLELGTAYGNGFEVLGGLAAGDKVVTTGSFLLKTEVLRGQIGAG